MKKIRITLCFVSVCWLLTFNAVAQQNYTPEQLAGTYLTGGGFGGMSIEINKNRKFKINTYDCASSTKQIGEFNIVNKSLNLKITKHERHAKLPLETQQKLYPIKWGERIYLLYEDDFQDFVHAVNFGIEPRGESVYGNYYTFLLRNDDEKKQVHGLPDLPVKWRDLILDKPVTAIIVAAKKVENGVAVINQGSSAGLKVGMRLIKQDFMPEPWSDTGVIISITETSAIIRAGDLKIGDQISSVYKPISAY